MIKRFLTGRNFKAALELLHERGINDVELCALLQCGNNQPRRWSKTGAPRYIALAITALLEERPAWKPERKPK